MPPTLTGQESLEQLKAGQELAWRVSDELCESNPEINRRAWTNYGFRCLMKGRGICMRRIEQNRRMILLLTTVQGQLPYTVEEFKNQTLMYCENRGSIRVTGASWEILTYVPLKNYDKLYNELDTMTNHCKETSTGYKICSSEAYKISIEKHNETKKSNRYVVSRLIDATCYLAKQELPFRGHDEQITSTNRGNYVELINLMGTLDLKLSGHLSTATVFSGLSGDIQNDLIQSISNVLMKRVTLEIKNVDFVSIIMDETTDVVSKSQLSIIFRYITHEGVQERFLGFVDVSQDRSAKCLAEYTFNILQGYNCENKLIAQTYYGAAVMSGQHNGLQALVRLKCKNAMFVHCYAHKLNLILKQSVDHIKECKVFFLTLSGISSFFSKSTKRIYALEQEVKKKFPSVAPTRWNYNSRLVEMMSEYKQEVLNLMGTIIENGEKWDSETLSCARGFFQTI
ncbi:hypothetical protein QTP88_029346 [Uroleucon formosanum]